MKKLNFLFGMLLVLIIAPGSLNADLISADDEEFGAGSITVDTDTGYEWLDVTLSVNYTWIELMDQTEEGGLFEGFQLANVSKVLELFENAGIDMSSSNVPDPSQDLPVVGLMELVGVTYGTIDNGYTFGLTADLYNVDPQRAVALNLAHKPTGSHYSVDYNRYINSSEDYIGGWLYRTNNSLYPVISVSSSSIDFGNAVVGDDDDVQIGGIGIFNTGTAPLIFSGITLSDGAHFWQDYGDGCGGGGINLWPGESCSVYIYFAPQTIGIHNDILTINSNDPNSPTVIVHLIGTGIQVDNKPYFDNASLPSSVTIPGTIPFSGYVKDDVGLDQISMSVNGASVFDLSISGLSKSLSDYYFDSDNAEYAGSAGNYTVILTVEDSIGQTSSKSFNVTVSEQQVDNKPYFDNASLPSSVTIPGTIPFSGYVKDDVGLDQISMSVNGASVFDLSISGLSKSLSDYYFDSDNAEYAGSAGNYTVILTVEDSIGQTSSKSFNVTVSEQQVDNKPYFDNASLPSSVTIPGTIPFSGYVKDDVGLDQISMSVNGASVFDLSISGLSKSLSDYYFDSDNAEYAGSAGNYTVILTVEDSIGQTASKNFTVTVSEQPVDNIPVADINSPSDGSSFIAGDVISFIGSATDHEDGNLTAGSLVWTSNIDGQLGTGININKSDLSIGNHIITLTAYDSYNNTGSYSVSIAVNLYSNSPPEKVEIISPYDGQPRVGPPNSTVLYWNPSRDDDGDPFVYCIAVYEDGDPDIAVFEGCKHEIFISDEDGDGSPDTSFVLSCFLKVRKNILVGYLG